MTQMFLQVRDGQGAPLNGSCLAAVVGVESWQELLGAAFSKLLCQVSAYRLWAWLAVDGEAS